MACFVLFNNIYTTYFIQSQPKIESCKWWGARDSNPQPRGASGLQPDHLPVHATPLVILAVGTGIEPVQVLPCPRISSAEPSHSANLLLVAGGGIEPPITRI